MSFVFTWSLEDFLRWEEKHVKNSMSGRAWLWWYERAKASYEEFGDDGPPVGSTVTTLVAGHGGGPGCYRTFKGVWQRDERFFSIERVRSSAGESLVERAVWWREIAPGELNIRSWND